MQVKNRIVLKGVVEQGTIKKIFLRAQNNTVIVWDFLTLLFVATFGNLILKIF